MRREREKGYGGKEKKMRSLLLALYHEQNDNSHYMKEFT